MSAFEDFIQLELPRRPWVTYNPDQETVPVRRGAGPRQLDFVALQEGQVLGKEGGVITGITLPSYVPRTYIHVEEGSPMNQTWVITHNKSSDDYIISIYDVNGSIIIPDSVDTIDTQTIHVTFSIPTSGKAVMMFASYKQT